MRFALFFPVLFFCAAVPAFAVLLEGLPGEEVTSSPQFDSSSLPRAVPVDSNRGVNWLAPSVEEQLVRDPSLFTLGKGAVFVPTFSESRREPDVEIFNPAGSLVTTGQTGQRILLDTGTYVVRFGSGTTGQRLHTTVHVVEGHTSVLPPFWGALLVETLIDSGQYIEGQYDLIRLDKWTNYGRGSGFLEERLQDIKIWVLPPGLYRLSKTGEGYNSLQNYITVQINPGELHSVELIFDKSVGGNLIAGGTKSLTTHSRAGRHWTYGLRAGGNFDLTRNVDETDLPQQSLSFSTDLRARARYDVPLYFGTNEIFLQNGFLRNAGQPISTTSDFLQMHSTWVRRLNSWLGPYVRGEATAHIFPTRLDLDTAYRVKTGLDSTGKSTTDTIAVLHGSIRTQPPLFPVSLGEGMGVNVEWLSRYELTFSTQLGLAARQQISSGDYLARTSNSFERDQSSSTVGLEGLLTGTMRLSTQFTLDLRAEIFAENGRPSATQLEDLEADFRFFLSSHLEIGYLFQMSQILDQVANHYPTQQSLSLRLNFNY